MTGINNTVAIRDSVNTVGFVYGIQNRLSYTSPLGTPRITGNYYGYFSSVSTAFTNKVDGNAYGIFLGNVTAAGANRNYGIFTNKGANRFGDSVLVTDGVASRPRAVLDVNANSAMIIPAGTNLQRPPLLYPGMLRYNTDIGSPEAYTGTTWISLKNPVLPITAALDVPAIPTNGTVSIIVIVAGAQLGNTVTVSPDGAPINGMSVAWARVSAANTIEIAFGNFSATAIDPPVQNYFIKVVQ